MAEPYRRRSPLSHRGLAARAAADPAAGVTLGERPHLCQVNLRGDPADALFTGAVRSALGLDLPVVPNSAAYAGDVTALWLGPNEWLIVAPPGQEARIADSLRSLTRGLHAAVTDVSESRTVVMISGPRARDLLAKATSLDLHPRLFGPGRCAQSGFAKTNAILHQIDDRPTYALHVPNSFADYFWTWLERAGAEYGVAVAA